MTALLGAIGIVSLLLCVEIIDLLRRHGMLLRRMHEIEATDPDSEI